MKFSWKTAGLLGLAALAVGLVASPAAAENMSAKKCLKCHSEFKDMKNLVAGDFQSRSNKAKSISVMVAPGKTIILKFTPQTKVENVPSIKKLKKPIPVRVSYVKQGSDLVATEIVAKPQIKVPEKQVMGVKELSALVAKGPEKGGYTLVDSRPPIRYYEGHIPGAVMMPFPKMPEMMGKLPKDKSALVIFYCQGFR
ncbi:MAG: rhodanese-like domain-containing protein [Desulfarculaceae bacterium]|nr:rhodanese-like domain-containing protein [Desulfarculaceae bacterium]MCF8074449.1 rhodanese-like domain-containing protein [Desulfarculaceae bacterium]MCF8102711.1 rhodanese-like domain-containing protein [Desulfarculaceae bacterium]MCF8116434.1 rhodanese-like domain-containing protein [Desulfarculaceae bacterium]